MDIINNFIDEYIFSDRNESKIGEYDNEVVDLLNKLIRVIIAFGIVYLIIQRLPDHGDKDHTMYFNLILIITIFLLLTHIRDNWYEIYDRKIVQDNHYFSGGNPSENIGENIGILYNIVYSEMYTQVISPENWFYFTISGLVLSALDMSLWYTFLAFLPIEAVQGTIYWITFVSKYSPIRFIFGDISPEDTYYIYEENRIGKTATGLTEDAANISELKNLNDYFYIMYIVLILLIFFTIIIRLTTDTIISCDNFIGPIPIDLLQGCNGYRFYMVFNIILFIGFSTDFIDSLQKISLDKQLLNCSMKKDGDSKELSGIHQIYTSANGDCLAPEEIIETPNYCNAEEHIIECAKSDNPPQLEGCQMYRSDYNDNNFKLKELKDYVQLLETIPPGPDHVIDGKNYRIIVKEDSSGLGGYTIDTNKTPFIDEITSECRDSIEKWLKGYRGNVEPVPITGKASDPPGHR